MIEHFYQQLDGWFDFEDSYRDAVASAQPGAVFVEVGAWLGKSTSFMAVEIANSGKPITFYVVDTWLGTGDDEKHQRYIREHGSVKPIFDANMAPVRDYYRALHMPSIEAAETFADASVDFIWIDADHRYDAVKADLAAWTPKLKPGGIIGGHDFDWGGVNNAVREKFGVEFWTVGNCWKWRKTK